MTSWLIGKKQKNTADESWKIKTKRAIARPMHTEGEQRWKDIQYMKDS